MSSFCWLLLLAIAALRL